MHHVNDLDRLTHLWQYVLPLIFLLMRRALWIIKRAGSVTLHDEELEIISDSLSIVVDAVDDRVETLQGIYHPRLLDSMMIRMVDSHRFSNVQAPKSKRKGSAEEILLRTGLFSSGLWLNSVLIPPPLVQIQLRGAGFWAVLETQPGHGCISDCRQHNCR